MARPTSHLAVGTGFIRCLDRTASRSTVKPCVVRRVARSTNQRRRGSTDHLTERLFGLRICVVNPQRGPTVERPERPLPSASSGSAPLRPNTGRDERNKCRAGRPTRDRAREKGNRTTTVLSRTTTTSLAGRASSMRRQRRRVMHTSRPYCRTNGCASFLDIDPITGTASCPICGYVLRPH